jgi:hypothetical protein
MSIVTRLTRREAIRLVGFAVLSNGITRHALGQMRPSSGTPATRTVNAEGTDAVMQITETLEGGIWVVLIKFVDKNTGKLLYQTRTLMDNKSQGDSRTNQVSTDGHFTYSISVTAKTDPDHPKAPPTVVYSSEISMNGRTEKFFGTLGMTGPVGEHKEAPGLDGYISTELRRQLTPFRSQLEIEIKQIQTQSDGRFNPAPKGEPHSWVNEGCKWGCAGLASAAIAAGCGGTFGIGCVVSIFGLGLAERYCERTCPA